MADREQLPPPGLPIKEIRTPDHTDVFYRIAVDRTTPIWQNNSPIKRGTLYSDLQGADVRISEAYPTLYFVRETVPIGSNTIAGMTQSDFVIWEFATSPDAESTYNSEVSFLGDSVGNSVFARVYTIRRDVYEAIPYILTGSPLTALIGVLMRNGGAGYKHAEATFDCGGEDAEVQFVISNGAIISAIVTKEGRNFNEDSIITIDGDGSGATCTPIIQPPEAILTSQKKLEFPDGDPMQHEFVKVLRVYEILPGPWIPFTRYSEDLGPIQGRRRAVLNTGQLGGVITPTSKTNYEGRDGSSIVSIEIQENWSNGTGVPGPGGLNPIYPFLCWSTYTDERGTVGHTSQVEASPFCNKFATLTHALTKATKTWFEPFAENPFLQKRLTETWTEPSPDDQKLTSEFGGAIANVTERTDEPGVQNAERGLLVISSETKTINPNEQTLRTVKNPAAAWPVLTGVHTDETTGIVVNFTKQVIDATTPYPGTTAQSDDCALVLIQGPFIEDQPYDWDKKIRIISVVDLNSLPKKQCWSILHPVNFPPQLLSVEAIWSNSVSRLVNSQAESANVMVSSGSSGGFVIKSSSGFRGNAKGRLERSYFYGPPNAGLVPSALKIIPSSGSVVLTQTHSRTTYQKGDDGGTEFGDAFQIQVQDGDIRDHLVGNFTLLGSPGDVIVGNQVIHTSPIQSATAVSGGGSVASATAFGTRSIMEVRIPQSTPTQLVSGTEVIMDVEVRAHPFGIYSMDVIYVTIP